MTLNLRLENRGWSAVPAGAVLAVYVEDAGSFVLVTRVTTTRALLPGESEAFAVPFSLAGRDPTADVVFRVIANDDGDPGVPDVAECRDANNEADVTASCQLVF